MGASIADHLAARGGKNVLLLEKEQFFGQVATGRCAGGVRYQFSTEINIQLQHRLGVQTIWLDGDEIRERLPMMNLDLIRMSIQPGKSPTLKSPQPVCPYWKMRDCYPIGLVFMRTHQMPVQFLDLLP